MATAYIVGDQIHVATNERAVIVGGSIFVEQIAAAAEEESIGFTATVARDVVRNIVRNIAN